MPLSSAASDVYKRQAKNILDFAWAADRDYSVDEFTVLGGPKVYFVYQKSEKTKYWEEAKPYVCLLYTSPSPRDIAKNLVWRHMV
nr:hypothetical protein [Elizabethkingia sp. ASV34]